MEKRIPLKKEVREKLEAQAKVLGKTADELAADIVLAKAAPTPVAEPTTAEPVKKRKGKSAKKSETPEAEKSVFPAKGMINAYGFLHLSNGVAEAFGTPKGKKTAVTIDFKDGNLIISKA